MARRRKTFHKAAPPENGQPLALTPDGVSIYSEEQLPDLPLPTKIVVSGKVIHVDGWHIRLQPMGQKLMDWLGRQAVSWCRLDSSPANMAQVNGVLDAMQTMIKKKSTPPIQGTFEF